MSLILTSRRGGVNPGVGRFCAIARGVKFIMNGANHMMSGISTYPFPIFGNGAIVSTRSVVAALEAVAPR